MPIKTKTVQKYAQEITDIICDACGQTCKQGHSLEFMTLHAKWGYGSKYDLEEWNAHLCEACVDKHLGFINFIKINHELLNSHLHAK